ncbi:tRNA nucleotidyltransferase [Brevundimonas phage vB_BpoS-Kikimora]|uniref:tRNA nucleotidyltransferase n=1 Tax=Brevundimonas phage vB_BpoS-Kikimora TaxID=2948601 RepID=A0A9E7MSK3_9CAUD|nr:tRNA nucleotidyltransferase [Brevundimonas phage vB_BpoS-Kikimora]
MTNAADIPLPLHALREAFVQSGHDLRFVGGCVRAYFMGEEAKDIDLCTDATPEEAMAIYRSEGLNYYLTGLEHGTITVGVGSMHYEITSLREEFDHDGRHAKVRFTRDWAGDLSRRDLTFNAMAMSFDGAIYDPHDGMADLIAGHVRFVGDATQRVKEDYLRILRYFRFYARYGRGAPDDASLEACTTHASGLETISGERIWQEMKLILRHRSAVLTLRHMAPVLPHIGVSDPRFDALEDVAEFSEDPVLRALALVGRDRFAVLAERWRWSNAEKDKAAYVAEKGIVAPTLEKLKYQAWVKDVPEEHLRAWCDYTGGQTAWREFTSEYLVRPAFPLKGGDFMAAGYAGPDIGAGIKSAKLVWALSDYKVSRDELLLMIQEGVECSLSPQKS